MWTYQKRAYPLVTSYWTSLCHFVVTLTTRCLLLASSRAFRVPWHPLYLLRLWHPSYAFPPVGFDLLCTLMFARLTQTMHLPFFFIPPKGPNTFVSSFWWRSQHHTITMQSKVQSPVNPYCSFHCLLYCRVHFLMAIHPNHIHIFYLRHYIGFKSFNLPHFIHLTLLIREQSPSSNLSCACHPNGITISSPLPNDHDSTPFR